MSQPAIFLDRDGTIIEDTHYINDPKKVILLPQSTAGLKLMKEKGYLLFVISNQSGVGRGIIKDEEFIAVHRRFCDLLQAEGIEITEFLYCFHRPDDLCGCRKPKAGLIPHEFGEKKLMWESSFTVGDKLCDLELSSSIGGKGYLVLTGKGESTLGELRERGDVDHFKVMPHLLAVALDLPVA